VSGTECWRRDELTDQDVWRDNEAMMSVRDVWRHSRNFALLLIL
jgi:hypothetical protein